MDTRTNLIWRKVIQPQRTMLKRKIEVPPFPLHVLLRQQKKKKKKREKMKGKKIELYGVNYKSCTQGQSIWVNRGSYQCYYP
jgi:hypothetical protein